MLAEPDWFRWRYSAMPGRPLFILVAAAFVLTTAGPVLAACGSTQVVQLGDQNRDPEKDTFGLLCGPTDVGRNSSLAGSARKETLQIGANTGEAEKDTLGYPQTTPAQ
jgi:hypothetical protein